MKRFTKNRVIQKIIAVLTIIVSLNFITPEYSWAADDGNGVAGGLLKEVVQLFAALGDVVMGGLNHFMLGTAGVSSSMLDQNDVNLSDKGENAGSWLKEGVNDKEPDVDLIAEKYEMDKKTFLLDANEFKIPNMLYSPENIFANNIAMLDINFLNPNQYESAVVEGANKDVADDKAKSAAANLQEIISSWYKSFRNIAIVGLLSVLVYLGIRILISSTAADKAKYKESIRDWSTALCLVFVIHFIMSGILMLTNNFNALFGDTIDNGIIVRASGSNGEELKFRTNLIGLARFKAQGDQWQDATAYTIIYLALVIYTIIFTVIYFKRFLYMAFFTMISPLVALTYPIDKVGDGKAQAFDMWFKEYTMNAIIQPVHLILYSVFVGSAIDLAVSNPIYALVAIGFLIPAEKFVKKMFGLDKAQSEGGFGSFAGGALTMKGLETLSHLGKGGKSKSSSKNSGDSSEDTDNGKINFAKEDGVGKLSEFGSGSNNPNEETEGNNGRMNALNSGANQEGVEDGQNQNSQFGMDNGLDGNNQSEFVSNGLEDGNIPTWNDMRNMRQSRDMFEADANNSGISDDGRETARQRLEAVNRDIARGRELRGQRRKDRAKGIGKFALRGAKKLAKGSKYAGKGLLRTAGVLGGATVGLAAGLTTGDMSKAFSYAATGAVVGNTMGKTAGNLPGRAIDFTKETAGSIQKMPGKIQDAWNEDMYGPAVARQKRIERQNAQARSALLRDDKQKEKALELAGKIGYDGPVEDILNAKADMYEQGITDNDLINNTIETEYKKEKSLNGDKHNQYVGAAAFMNKNKFTENEMNDIKKMRAFEERVQTQLKGDEIAQNEVMKMTTGILGADDLYSLRQQRGDTLIQPVLSKRLSSEGRQTEQQRQRQTEQPRQRQTEQPRQQPPRTQNPPDNT